MDWEGACGTAVAACLHDEVGLLDREYSGGVIVHGLAEKAESYRRAQHMRKNRKEKLSRSRVSNACVTRDTERRGEERRGEEKRGEETQTSVELDANSTALVVVGAESLESRSSEEVSCKAELDKLGSPSKNGRGDEVRQVFDHYRTYHPRAHPNPKSKSKEWRLVHARLEEGYLVDALRLAIDGCQRSPFHQGENERGAKYDSLELIMRDSDHVAKFIELAEQGPGPVLTEKQRRGHRAGEQWLARHAGGQK